ncbi:hypothetical protein [Streptomyces sp. NPDC048521]|uniref:hypothetical protein n=1 Tax=Streptomyces sp. NPDC048521 TaxID=3365566 RepID=UPI00371B180E
MTTSSTWDELEKQLNTIEKPVTTLKLCRDPEVRERYLTAKQAHEQADRYLKQTPKDANPEALALLKQEAADARKELAAAQKAYDEQTITLRFTALERKALEALQKQHPASEEDEERGEEWAMDTFAPALISAASLDGMPVEAARRYLDTWAPGDARDLWQAAWTIQHTRRTDLGKG